MSNWFAEWMDLGLFLPNKNLDREHLKLFSLLLNEVTSYLTVVSVTHLYFL